MTAPALSVPHVPVAQWRTPSADDFDTLADGVSEPIVLSGCLERWALVAQLRGAGDADAQLDRLDGLIGQRRLHYTSLSPQQHGHLGYKDDGTGTNFTFRSTKKKVAFTEFSRVLRNTLRDPRRGAVYMQSAPLDRFPELAPTVPDLPYLRQAPAGYRQLWIGSGGHIVNLHFDPTHNLIAMLAGQKRVTLVPPDNIANLYPAPLDCRMGDAIGSRVRLLEPDLARYPRAAGELAKAQVAELRAGDVLYIPPMWWHHVESFGLNVMINKWVPPISGHHFGDLTINVIDGILAFHDVPRSLRLRYRDFYYQVMFGEPVPASSAEGATADEAPIDASMLKRANQHMVHTSHVMRGVPACLRKVLPRLYDYYVFQVDGPPALSSNAHPERFMRSLGRYAKAVRTVGFIQRLFRR